MTLLPPKVATEPIQEVRPWAMVVCTNAPDVRRIDFGDLVWFLILTRWRSMCRDSLEPMSSSSLPDRSLRKKYKI